MRSFHSLTLFVGIILIALAADVQSQDRGSGGQIGFRLSSALLGAIDDPNLVVELKLTDDQVKKLTARRQEVWDDYFVTGMDKYAEDLGSRETDKLMKKVLSTDQYKRALQVAAQLVTSRQRPSRIIQMIRLYPELVDAYLLNDEQKQQVSGDNPSAGGAPNGPGEIPSRKSTARDFRLEPKQIDAAKEFMGDPYTKTLSFKDDPRHLEMPERPQVLYLYPSTDVKQEVNMTQDQAAQLLDLREKWNKLERNWWYSPKTMLEQKKPLAAETEKIIAKLLTQEQITRLRQIGFQTLHRSRDIDRLYKDIDRPYSWYSGRIFDADLKLKAEQIAKIDEIWKWFREEVSKAIDTSTTLDSLEKKIEELSKARREKAAAVLTAVQTAKFHDLVGEPFFGHASRSPPQERGPRAGNRPNDAAQELSLQASFGKYATELTQLADNYSVQRELRLSREQIRKAGEARNAIEKKFTLPKLEAFQEISPETIKAYKKTFDERSKAIEAEINKLLTAEQATRFREVMLQILKHTSETTFISPTMVVYHPIRYPGVAEAVKLTEDQRMRIIAEAEESPNEVLTREQKIAIAKMLGKSFGGTFLDMQDAAVIRRPPFPFRRLSYIPPPLVLLWGASAKDFDALLKLTPEQSKTIDKAMKEYRSELESGRVSAAENTFTKSVAGVLTADQEKRLAQLVLQINAATQLFDTLTAPEMVKKLELSEGQIDKLTDLNESASKLEALISAESLSEEQQGLSPSGRQSGEQQDPRIRKKTTKMMFAVLTDSQKATWMELNGEPWKDLPQNLPVPSLLPNLNDRGPGRTRR